MDKNYIKAELDAGYAKAGGPDFELNIVPIVDFRGYMTYFRHCRAAGVISRYSIVDENNGTVMIFGYDPDAAMP